MYAAMTLGAIGRELAPPVREQAARALIALLENADAGLVLVAIAGLQNLPCPETVPALRGMLKSRSLEQRASAALSLSVLGERSGEPVLREMLDPAVYEAERTADPRRWPPQRVSESRCKALDALIALGIPPAPEELRRMESAEADPKLQQAAARLLRDGASQ
jgi:HEAT repeat protein